MLQPRWCLAPIRGSSISNSSLRPSITIYDSLLSSMSSLTITHPPPSSSQIRHASHATQGRANGPAQGPGKRLGAKRAASELVVPGCIIFRQRGAKWWPGENCVMGRDHTISSLAKGYVRYYRDPINHPKRKLIGVVFEQHETLPRPANMPRRRRLGLEPRVIKPEPPAKPMAVNLPTPTGTIPEEVKMGFAAGYQYRPTNTEIGRAAKESGRVYPVYKPHNRWLAWRLRLTRLKGVAEKRALRQRTSAKGKAAAKKKAKARGKMVVKN